MAQTVREYQLLRDIEATLESEDVNSLQHSLLKLLTAYQKQSRRTEKIVSQSDRQQEQLLTLNGELEAIRNEQAKNITELIEDKKSRAKNIIESKKKIFEIHKQELSEYRSSIDELTRMIVEKDEAIAQVRAYEAENRRLKSLLAKLAPRRPAASGGTTMQIPPEQLQEIVASLELEHPLMQDILHAAKRLLKNELNFTRIDNFAFTKNAPQLLRAATVRILESYAEDVPIKEVGVYLAEKYREDLFAVFADHLIELVCEREANATRFVNFYNGEIAFASNGSRYQKPEITSPDGTRWNLSTIHQVALQKKSAIKQFEMKNAEVAKIQQDIKAMQQKILHLEKEIKQTDVQQQDANDQSNESYYQVEKLRKELLEKKQLLSKTKGAELDALNAELLQLGSKIRELQKLDDQRLTERKTLENTQEQKEIRLNIMKKDLEGYRKMYLVEQRKLQQFDEAKQPFEEKYRLAVSGLARAMLAFKA